ncbi:MAG: glycosyltransferase family protein, partial [Acidimicrobiia bacterium]
MQPEGLRSWSLRRRLVSAVVAEKPDLIYALTDADVAIASAAARQCDAAVFRSPNLRSAGAVDVIDIAPSDMRFSASPAGAGSSNHSPLDTSGPSQPEPGRHAGVRIVLAYRSTPTTPARFLRAAMERAGIDVVHVEVLDWTTIPSDAACVLIVESPYPAHDVIGTNPGMPVVLWAHHGEHHTDAHLRLVRRYDVDAVLLAHSWHLAHRYPVPVHRFPFGVPMGIVDASKPWSDRRFDVAFVGSMAPGAEAHRGRMQILGQAEELFGTSRVATKSGVSPEEMFETYASARVVVNDGGTRHHPITMRVFESVGSGALLATTSTPGLDQILTPGMDYLEIDVDTAGVAISNAIDDGRAVRMAASGCAVAEGRHLYDHRVDELLEIVEGTRHGPSASLPRVGDSTYARAVDAHVEIGTVAAIGVPDLRQELPLRAVWVDPSSGDRTYDAVVIGTVHHIQDASLADAVRYIVFDEASATSTGIRAWLADYRPSAIESSTGGIVT